MRSKFSFGFMISMSLVLLLGVVLFFYISSFSNFPVFCGIVLFGLGILFLFYNIAKRMSRSIAGFFVIFFLLSFVAGLIYVYIKSEVQGRLRVRSGICDQFSAGGNITINVEQKSRDRISSIPACLNQ